MTHNLINTVSEALIKQIGELHPSEARSFRVSHEIGNHTYTAEYFGGTFEKDGWYDILPGPRVLIDNYPYGLGEKSHIMVADEIYSNIVKSREYKDLQERFEARIKDFTEEGW